MNDKEKALEMKVMKNLLAFDEQESGEEKEKEIFRQARRRSEKVVLLLSFIVVVIVLMLMVLLKLQITPYLVKGDALEQELYHSIYGANSYTSDWTETYKLFGSQASALEYKLVEGVPVLEGRVSVDGEDVKSIINEEKGMDWEKNQYSTGYYLNGIKAMQFFVPWENYPQYADDFDMVEKMGDEKVGELALSFDKDYTLEEIESMLPPDVTLAWCWVDNFDKSQFGEESAKQVLLGDEVMGFSLLNKAGAKKEDPIADFKVNLEFGMAEGKTYRKMYADIYETLGRENISQESVRIIGAVVTGRPDSLENLKGLENVRAASLGASADKY